MGRGSDESYPTNAVVQVLVKSDVLNEEADLPISSQLMTAVEIDDFVEQSITNLRAVQTAAKAALESANPN